MLRVWGKVIKKNRIQSDHIAVSDDPAISLGNRIHLCLDEICMELDLQRPIWLEQNKQDLRSFGRTEFRHDHFIEPISFDALEIEIIEMDEA